jgi:hypothetical protein
MAQKPNDARRKAQFPVFESVLGSSIIVLISVHNIGKLGILVA